MKSLPPLIAPYFFFTRNKRANFFVEKIRRSCSKKKYIFFYTRETSSIGGRKLDFLRKYRKLALVKNSSAFAIAYS
jgi:hypothetical protein